MILRGNFLTFPTLIGKTNPDPCYTLILGQGQLVNEYQRQQRTI